MSAIEDYSRHELGFSESDPESLLEEEEHRALVDTDLALRRKRPEISHGPPARCGLRGMHDRVGVDIIVMIEVRNRSGLTEMLDTERLDPMPLNAAEP